MAKDDGGMPLLDEVFGRFDPDSRHPFLGLPGAGGQWPEERSFARIANVYALARLAQVLVGLQGYVIHGASAGDAVIARVILPKDRKRYAAAIAVTLECLVELCPDMFSDKPIELDRDLGLEPYVADDRMKTIVARAFNVVGLVVPDLLLDEYDEMLGTGLQPTLALTEGNDGEY